MVLSARRNHSESSMGRTCVIVVCTAHWVISQFGNTYSCHMCTKTLLRFWLMKKSAPFAAFLRALSSLTVPHAETLRQNQRQVTAESSISHDALLFPLSRCQNLVSTPPNPYKIYLINVDQRTSWKLLSLCFSFYSAFSRRSSCICFQQKHPPAVPWRQNSYQSCSLLISDKLALTFWVRRFDFDAGPSGTLFSIF